MENKDLQFGIIKTVANTDDYQLLTHLFQILNHKDTPVSFPFSDLQKSFIPVDKEVPMADEALPSEVVFYQNLGWLSE
jgi:hypothetical protein